MNEKWKQIYFPLIIQDTYSISTYGRIRNDVRDKFIKCQNPDHNNGYVTVCLKCVDGKRRKFLLHRLVLGTFVGYQNDKEVNHINAIKTDNRIDNLEYTSRLENAQHAASHNLYQRGSDRHNSVLTEDVVRRICEMLHDNTKPLDIFRILSVCYPEITLRSIRGVMNRESWTYISDDYEWDKHRLKYQQYDFDDLLSIGYMIKEKDISSADIARQFPQYEFTQLHNVIKKMREGKLYKEILHIVMGSSTIESITENINSRGVSE